MRLRGMAVFLKGNTYRIRADASQMALAIHGEAVPFGEGFHGAIYCGKKIIAVGLNVKADEVGAQQTVDQFALPGADAENFRIRPGNVPEDGDAGIGARFLDHAGKQREMIILDQRSEEHTSELQSRL